MLFSHLGHYIHDIELQQDDSNFVLSIEGENINPYIAYSYFFPVSEMSRFNQNGLLFNHNKMYYF